MPVLVPNQAMEAARGIYDILATHQLATRFGPSIRDNFDLSGARQFNGKSGFTLMQTESGFGLAAMGKGPHYQHDALITLRGTKKSVDWVTDAHAGINLSNGKLVHSGFNKVFRSFQTEISTFFRNNRPARVHLVGHSLGGAVATLVAEWVKQNTAAEPILYTFGSPRVGSRSYAQGFTSTIKPENIYRVYHKNDPVPMVPIWPFVHVPIPGNNYAVSYSGSDSTISFAAHYKENYLASMQNQTWETLRRPAVKATHYSEIEFWLASTNNVGGRLTYSYMRYVEDSITYILEKAALLTGIVIQADIMGTSSMLDVLAMTLAKGVALSKEFAELLMSLLSKLLAVYGIVVDKTKQLTAEFIRWAFQQMANVFYVMARTALRATLHKA